MNIRSVIVFILFFVFESIFYYDKTNLQCVDVYFLSFINTTVEEFWSEK